MSYPADVRSFTEGWPIVGWAALLVGALVAGILATMGATEAALHVILRDTARVSLVLFSTALIASPARRLWRNAATAWILRNRRQLGVSFAVSHTYHLIAIVALAEVMTPARFVAATGVGLLVAGGLGYLLIYAMAATSFDRTAAWLGPRRWKLLHRTGMYGLAAFFALTYAPAPFVRGWVYVPFALIAVGAPAFRIAARRRAAPAPAGA